MQIASRPVARRPSARPALVRIPLALAALGVLCGTARGAVLTVTSLADPVPPPIDSCTLRGAITAINTGAASGGCTAGNAGDAIRFALSGTIPLSADLPAVQRSLSIEGPGTQVLAIDGQKVHSAFTVDTDGLSVQMWGFTVRNAIGPATGGGAFSIGPAAAIPGTSVVLSDLELVGNGAQFGGGVDVSGGASVQIVASTFSGNFTAGFGGALDVWNGSVYVENCTFDGNRASASSGGGAIFVGPLGSLGLKSSTIASNVAASPSATGGGVKVVGGTVTILNSIVSGNVAASSPDVSGTVVSQGYNLVTNRGASSGWVASDLADGLVPGLGALQVGTPWRARTRSISGASPATNAIPGCNASPAIDQRGVARPFGPACDVGSYEYDGAALEVSGTAGAPLFVRESGASVVLEFADAGTNGYNVYSGLLPMAPASPYTHSSSTICNVATSLASGRRTTIPFASGADRYFLVTGYTAAEGPAGYDSNGVQIPASLNVCAP